MIPAVANLNVNEKLDLLWEIWDSLSVNESQIPISEEDRKEMQRRLDLYDKGELSAESWKDARAKILAGR